MSRHPIINGIAALAYIALVSFIMNFSSKMISRSNSPVAAIAVISLFTLSAAVMGYIFCYQPAQLYFDNKKKQAIKLFIQTVIAFAVMTSLVFILLFFGIF